MIIGKNTRLQVLSGEYNQGYTKAILDIRNIFEYVEKDLQYHHKKFNYKLMRELLKCIFENRDKLRDYNNLEGFIRWNCKTEKFEYFEGVK